MTKELINATEYIMSYKDFKGSHEERTENVWQLYNRKNTNTGVIHLDILQCGNDGNGFYPNFIKLIVVKVIEKYFDEVLSELKYSYKKYDVKVQKIKIDSTGKDYSDKIDEYVLEVE